MEAAIEIRDLRVDYGELTAVNNLSLTISRGEIYGLVGPNGAGKTSTLNVLATLLEPTYGTVHMGGRELGAEPNAIRARLGYMPDLAPVIEDLKVWEFLDLFAAAYGIAPEKRKERVEACLRLVKMESSRNTFCGTLSRGMSQRVVLAKTLLHRPDILLLDEPASGMDPLARIDLKDALQAVVRDGATVIISSHILSELAEMATSVGILHKGRLRAHGSVQEVLSGIQTATRLIRLEVLESPENCRRWLEDRGLLLRDRRNQSAVLEVELTGGLEEQARLLKDLVEAGFAVHHFEARKSNLEDLMRAISSDPDEPESTPTAN